MPVDLQIHELRGNELDRWLDALGNLRIRVFREYPYLYDGDLDYERNYLRIYQQDRALVVIVTDGDSEMVGATTCLPLELETSEFQAPFLKSGHPPEQVMYFGESILLPEWRGHGLGKVFFDRREIHARSFSMKTTAFCAVDRPDDHPLRPADYRPLDGFWQSRGYEKQNALRASFSWKEIGEVAESPKTLTFWTRSWDI